MKLSIIVPVYKAEKYLHQCLDSLLAQNIADYEIILINDGSPDGSGEIMEQYRLKYPDIIKSCTVENGGQGRARNIGLSMAKGEYIGFVDSDDYIEPYMYQHLIDKAEAEKADIVVCNFCRAYDDGRREDCVSWNDRELLLSAGSCCDKLFRRELIRDIRFPEGVWYEDFCFSAKLTMLAQKVVNIDEVLYIYRCGQQSTMTNQNSLKNLDMITVMEEIRLFVEENHLDKRNYEYLLINHALLDTVNRLSNHDTDEREEVILKIRSYIKANIPKLFACESFKSEGRNRRIIMALNYYGLHRLSRLILGVKSK